jgi:hypothetical protein
MELGTIKQASIIVATAIWTTGPAQIALILGSIAVGAVWTGIKIGEKICDWKQQCCLEKSKNLDENTAKKWTYAAQQWSDSSDRLKQKARAVREFFGLYLLIPAVPVYGFVHTFIALSNIL